VLAAALGAWLLPPDGVLADCERDGHFQRMGQVACGLMPAKAPYGPLLPWLGAALTPVAGTPYLAGRLLALFSLLGTVALTWRAVARSGAGAGAAALAAILVASNPHLLLYGTMACTDLPASALWLGALFLAATSVEEPGGAWRAGIAGACGALAVLVRVQWLLPLAVLGGLTVLLAGHPWRARLFRGLIFLAGMVLPLGIAAAVGLWHDPDLRSVLLEYLGGIAFTRAVPRLGALAAGGAPAEGTPGLATRLAWGAWLAVRVSGGLPLIGLVVGLGLAMWRRMRPWRSAQLTILASGACWAATAWSHPPPDLGARRFFLALVPPGVVFAVGLSAGLARRVPRRGVLAGTAGLLVAAAVFFAVETASLRGVEARPGWAGLPLPRPENRATDTDRAAWLAGHRLLEAERPGCAPVYTNYHNAAMLFADPRFLGSGDLPAAVASLPRLAPESRAYLLWVPPPGAAALEPPRVPGITAVPLESGPGVATFRLEPASPWDGP
jgi:hypothetical protein